MERISLFFDFGNVFTSISLNISDIEVKEDLNIDESKNFNISVQIYLVFEKKHKEFTIIRVNLNIIKNNGEEYPYNEDNLYLEFNNVEYNDIIQINCIYDYYIFYLESKAINNFFFKVIFRFIKKTYKEEETRYWIFIIRTTMYRTFILSFEYLLIYIKKKAILERC